MRYRNSLIPTLAAAASAMTLSFFLHSPWSEPNIYSDIGSFWARPEVQQGLVPYFQYFFEYPPIAGMILYFSRIVGGSYNGYYTVFGLLSLGAAMGTAWSCWRVVNLLGKKLNPLYFFLPSVIVYGVYNFDFFNALFIILSVQFMLERRRTASAVALGLSIALKLVGVFLLPVYLLELRPKTQVRGVSSESSTNTTFGEAEGYLGRFGSWIRHWWHRLVAKVRAFRWRDIPGATMGWIKANADLLEYLIVTAAVVGAFFLPIAIINKSFLSQFYNYLKTWGLEDAWYIWIFQNPFSAAAKWFGTAVAVILLLRVYTLRVSIVPKAFLALAAYLLGAYIYSPQFNISLLPFVIVLAVQDPSLFSWEVFNALIILTWFLPTSLPASVRPSGWCPTLAWTLPQTMALFRSASLAWLCLMVLHKNGLRPAELLPRFMRRPNLMDSAPVPGSA